ncbi:hypothetical protein QAD02_021968 [Eretmocerus hayati]|uniref:Uncharacterized protein n=1 Tax=Eretmocerus hayati TaxID=131215 RepID=A0ACC2PS78_9HYME|nr:hypothetical protein QAD02_021968 [Eretmocerus hayati]
MRAVAGLRLTLILLLFSTTTGRAGSKGQQSAMGMKDLSQLGELHSVLRQASNASAEPGIAGAGQGDASVSATKQGPCKCALGVCSCCSRVLLNFWKQRACVNVTYDPDEFAFTAKLSMNDQLLFKRTVSGKNPRPVCVPVPRIPAIRACVRFYNIYFQGRNVHACVNMEGKFRDTVLFKVGMDCLRLGSNGVALVKPEDGGGIGAVELLPDNQTGETNAAYEEDYDGYDDYDDGDDDDDFFGLR